ncbi:MAG TPA: methyltransferase domain-containing protein, partial [Bdellovibrionota bacterium]|nr:methyltransferase domain-containing protein [Bdellovibrionota bacterium]
MSISFTLLGFAALFLAFPVMADEIHPSGQNAYQTVTGDDTEDDRRHWDRLFNTQTYVFGKEPAAFLKENIKSLPQGRVLDIAMGEGRNAVYLARKGYKVEGVDISEVALRKARRLAKENRVSVQTINADLNVYNIKPDAYDVILNIDYLQRSLIPQIKKGLKKGGVVVFENHTIEQLQNTKESIPSGYLLEKGELKELFKDLQILHYSETNDGKEARASLIA